MDTTRIFISYSHEDRCWFEEEGNTNFIPWLAKNLRQNGVEFWYDDELRHHIGVKFKDKIKEEIDKADFVLLLISEDFVSSEFIRDYELPWIREAVEKDKLSIIPVLVALVDWDNVNAPVLKWLGSFQTHPRKPHMLSEFVDRPWDFQKVRHEILKSIRLTVQNRQERPPQPPPPPPPSPPGPDTGESQKGISVVDTAPSWRPWWSLRLIISVSVGVLLLSASLLFFVSNATWRPANPAINDKGQMLAEWEDLEVRSVRVTWDISSLPAAFNGKQLYLATTADHMQYWCITGIQNRRGNYVFGFGDGQRYALIVVPTTGPMEDEMPADKIMVILEAELPR